MYNNDSIYADMDLYSSSNRLFAFNDASNIWSSDKLLSMDFNKQKAMINNNSSFMIQDRFSRNRKPPGDRRDTNLIVNYLPDGFYEKELFELFSQAGPIVHHHVVRNKDNRSECYGFVDFEKASDADKAIEMFHQFPIQNKKLKVQNAAEGLLIKEEERHRAIKFMTNVGYNVEIRNAPIRWTINDVKSVFGKYGEMLKVYESVSEDCENVTEIKTKTFNIIYRYHTIAIKVVKKKNKTAAEALWPLELELSIVGQEIIDIKNDESTSTTTTTSRRRGSKHQKCDQMSESSWENKVENAFFPSGYENPINYWSPSEAAELSSNGRPILKHLNNQMYEPSDEMNPFFSSCSDLKSIWAPPVSQLQEALLQPSEVYVRTPLVQSRFHREDSSKGGYRANVFFKMENMQPSGSFKLRGMAVWCHRARLEGVELVVSSSGGNAGLAAAFACRQFRLRCVVYVPITTGANVVAELRLEGAEVVQEGQSWADAHARAEARASTTARARLCHPFDCPLLWAGYESIVDEVVEDLRGRRLDMLVVAVGGGGLLNGLAQGVARHRLARTTALLAMETEGCAALNRSIAAGTPVGVVPAGLATSLGASQVSQRTWDLYCSSELHLFSKTCSDLEAVDACCLFLGEQNSLVEPACGAALSVIYNGTLDKMAECRSSDLNIVVVVCGGRCVDVAGLLEARRQLQAASVSTLSLGERLGGLAVSPVATVVKDNKENIGGGGKYSPRNYAAAVLTETNTNGNSNNNNISLDRKFGRSNNVINLLDNSTSGNSSLLSLGNHNQSSQYQYHRGNNYQNQFQTGMTTMSSLVTNAMGNSIVNSNSLGNMIDGGSMINMIDVPSPVGSQHSDKENRLIH